MKTLLQFFFIILVLSVSLGIAWYWRANRPEAVAEAVQPRRPYVAVQSVEASRFQVHVRSQGKVTPRSETSLAAEVTGRVVAVSANLVSGAFFKQGDALLEIERTDYELTRTGAASRLAAARLSLERERSEASVARRQWESLGPEAGEASPLAMHTPQLENAEAAVEAALAELTKAELDLARTTLRAPYAGRVRSERVDVGQYITRGEVLGELYAVDAAEVRLCVSDSDLRYLDLPLDSTPAADFVGPLVELTGSFAGGEHTWPARIVRMEGELDARTGMATLVARVEDPYGRGEETSRPPLFVGLFVEAAIVGHEYSNVVVVPRTALQEGERVFVVDAEDQLRFRPVEVVWVDRSVAVISSGLAAGERLCLTQLDAPVDKMTVKIEGSE